MSSLSSLTSSSRQEEEEGRRFPDFGVPPEKKQKLRRGTGKDYRERSTSPTMNPFVWNSSFVQILQFMCGRIPSSALKKSTVRDIVSPPHQALAMYLGDEEPLEPQIHAFMRKRWSRIHHFLMNPVPGIILHAQMRTEDIPSIKQGPNLSQRFCQLEQISISKKLQKQECNAQQAEEVPKLANSISKKSINYNDEVVAAMRKKLLDMIQRIIQCLRQGSQISRRGATTVFEIINVRKAPTEFMNSIEAEIISLFINELGILKVRQKGQNPPTIVS